MVVLSIILGVLMILGGIFCLFTPVMTLLMTGYLLGILFFVFGLTGILRAITTKTVNALGMVTDILALIVGVIAIFRPGSTIVIDRVIIWLVAFWFLIEGIFSIVVSVKNKAEVKGWYWGLIAGILGCIVGIILITHPLLRALTTGIMIGICFLQAGIQTTVFAIFHKGDKKGDKQDQQ